MSMTPPPYHTIAAGRCFALLFIIFRYRRDVYDSVIIIFAFLASLHYANIFAEISEFEYKDGHCRPWAAMIHVRSPKTRCACRWWWWFSEPSLLPMSHYAALIFPAPPLLLFLFIDKPAHAEMALFADAWCVTAVDITSEQKAARSHSKAYFVYCRPWYASRVFLWVYAISWRSLGALHLICQHEIQAPARRLRNLIKHAVRAQQPPLTRFSYAWLSHAHIQMMMKEIYAGAVRQASLLLFYALLRRW